MDSHLAQPKIFVKQIVGAAVAAAFLLLAFLLGTTYIEQSFSPYIQSVFDRQGDTATGQQIFLINCAGCHGMQADGLVGPSLHGISRRRSSTSLIHQVPPSY